MNKELLIIFIKNPAFGKVKTRLAATVGPEKALSVYQQLLERTQNITRELTCDKALYYSDFIPAADNWESAEYIKKLQQGGDLGERMLAAFEQGFSNGYNRICIIGSDCYELTSAIINQAFLNLQNKDFVIGPSEDGGYYLLGMKKLHPFLFVNKSWSTNTVFRQTFQEVKENKLAVSLLPTLTDVDEEKDLHTMPFH